MIAKLLAYISWIPVIIATLLAKFFPSVSSEIIVSCWIAGIILQMSAGYIRFSGPGRPTAST
jgi:hypothetical protein